MTQESTPYYGVLARISATLRCALGGAVIFGAGAEVFDYSHVSTYAWMGALLGGGIGLATRAWRILS